MMLLLKALVLAAALQAAKDKPPPAPPPNTPATAEEAKQAIEQFKTDCKSPLPFDRAAAIAALSFHPHEDKVSVIGRFLTQDEAVVRVAAAKGLEDYGDHKKKVTPLLANALNANAKLPLVQAALLHALGKMKDDGALQILHRNFTNEDPAAAKAALEGAAESKSVLSVDAIIALIKELEKKGGSASGGGGTLVNLGDGVPGIGGLPGGGADDKIKERHKVVFPAALDTLKVITGKRWVTSAEWIAWWDKHKTALLKEEKERRKKDE